MLDSTKEGPRKDDWVMRMLVEKFAVPKPVLKKSCWFTNRTLSAVRLEK